MLTKCLAVDNSVRVCDRSRELGVRLVTTRKIVLLMRSYGGDVKVKTGFELSPSLIYL